MGGAYVRFIFVLYTYWRIKIGEMLIWFYVDVMVSEKRSVVSVRGIGMGYLVIDVDRIYVELGSIEEYLSYGGARISLYVIYGFSSDTVLSTIQGLRGVDLGQ